MYLVNGRTDIHRDFLVTDHPAEDRQQPVREGIPGHGGGQAREKVSIAFKTSFETYHQNLEFISLKVGNATPSLKSTRPSFLEKNSLFQWYNSLSEEQSLAIPFLRVLENRKKISKREFWKYRILKPPSYSILTTSKIETTLRRICKFPPIFSHFKTLKLSKTKTIFQDYIITTILTAEE